MPVISESRGAVRVLRMEHGPVNAMDVELLGALAEAFAEAREHTVILTGTGVAFSAGVDLKRVLAGGTDYLREFLPLLTDAFLAVVRHPRPVVAAVNGHAIAGGHVLMACCDRRIMADGDARVGVPELYVGVPFPASALAVLEAVTNPPVLRELLLLGRTYPPAAALERRVVDEIAAPDALLETAMARATRMDEVNPATFALTRRQLLLALETRCAALREAHESEVENLWYGREAMEAIQRYVDNLAARG